MESSAPTVDCRFVPPGSGPGPIGVIFVFELQSAFDIILYYFQVQQFLIVIRFQGQGYTSILSKNHTNAVNTSHRILVNQKGKLPCCTAKMTCAGDRQGCVQGRANSSESVTVGRGVGAAMTLTPNTEKLLSRGQATASCLKEDTVPMVLSKHALASWKSQIQVPTWQGEGTK